MAPARPFRWPRRARRGSRRRVLAAYGVLMGLAVGLVAIGWVARTAVSQPTPAPSESVDAPSGPVEVERTVLRPGTMVFHLRNNGVQPVTIAQVSVNDAFWPFTAGSRTTVAPHGTAVLTLRYPWEAGMAYEVQFIASTGATFVTDIAAITTARAATSR